MLVYFYGGLVVSFFSRDRNLAVLLMYDLAALLRRPPFVGWAGGGHCVHSCCPAGLPAIVRNGTSSGRPAEGGNTMQMQDRLFC